MSDPADAIQKAVVARLEAEGLPNVFDWFESDVFPRITIGSAQSIANLAPCYDGTEHVFDLNVWSRERGYRQAKTLASQVRLALNEQILPLDGHTMELMQVQSTQFQREQDGDTSRAIITVRVLSQPSD